MQITRYDETLVDNRSVNLTNQIDVVDIDVPVGFSIPNGSFRLWEQTPITFTHFTANVPSFGGDTVFVITNLVCINSEVTEYYYSIDYLKDYWNRYSSYSVLPLANTMISSMYSLDDVQLRRNIFPVNTHVTPIAEGIQELTGNTVNVSKPVIVMISARGGDTSLNLNRIALKNASNEPLSTKVVYTITEEIGDLDELYSAMLAIDPSDDSTFSAFYSNISNAFYCPILYAGTGATLNQDDVIYFIKNDGGQGSKTFAGTALSGKIKYVNLPTSNGILENVKETGITINIDNANDLPPYKKYQMYVPYIGWYDLPINEIFPQILFYETKELIVKYYFDLINGTVSARFGVKVSSSSGPLQYWSNYTTPYVPLPTIPLPTSNYAANQIMAENARNSSLRDTAISSLMGIGVGLVTGNPIAGILTSGFTKSVNAQTAYEQASLSNSLGGFTSGRDSSIGQTDRQFKLHIIEFSSTLTYAEGAKLYGYPVNTLTDAIAFNTHDNLNEKYWLDVSNSNIQGSPWYTVNVRNTYNQDYITYTPTLP